jgi:hypothetical protein
LREQAATATKTAKGRSQDDHGRLEDLDDEDQVLVPALRPARIATETTFVDALDLIGEPAKPVQVTKRDQEATGEPASIESKRYQSQVWDDNSDSDGPPL